MCTAYELGKRGGSFPDHLNSEAVDILLEISGSHLIRPTIPAPVILADGSPRTMHWGFRRAFTGTGKSPKPTWRTIVNSREDKLDGTTWKSAFAERRCLVPAAAFYEWVEIERRNVPLRFERPSGEWIWIAGIWEEDPQRGACFSMITTEPNSVLAKVHDRMPAVLGDTQISPFLRGELHTFGPSAVALEFREAPNFLRTKSSAKGRPPLSQGELF